MRNSRAPAGFRPNGWPFGLQSRSRLGAFEPAKSMESGEVLNPLKAWRVERYWRWATHAKQQSPTAGFQPKGWPFGLQRRSRLGTFEPAKSMEVFGAGQPMRNGRAPAGFRPNGWPFGLQSRSRLGTFEPAKSMESGEVLALGNPCETAKPLQDSGPMGGRLVCRADRV